MKNVISVTCVDNHLPGSDTRALMIKVDFDDNTAKMIGLAFPFSADKLAKALHALADEIVK